MASFIYDARPNVRDYFKRPAVPTGTTGTHGLDKCIIKLLEWPQVCWAHTLLKNIELHFDAAGVPFIQDPRSERRNHGDWTWLRSGYFLQWRNPYSSRLQDCNVTFIIFSATPELTAHLQNLATRPDWRQALMDPFTLFVITAENIFLEASSTINKVLTVLGYIEGLALGAAGGDGGEAENEQFDFVGLHNISNHIINLKEGCNAATAFIRQICGGHESIMSSVSDPERLAVMGAVHTLLLHKQTLVEGLVLRVDGMESRVQSLINL
ncbi:MAG: hypothetical protein Q9224_002499, partial [Gallowayella concinna]